MMFFLYRYSFFLLRLTHFCNIFLLYVLNILIYGKKKLYFFAQMRSFVNPLLECRRISDKFAFLMQRDVWKFEINIGVFYQFRKILWNHENWFYIKNIQMIVKAIRVLILLLLFLKQLYLTFYLKTKTYLLGK